MNGNKYGGNSIGKDKADAESDFGNNVHGVAPPMPCPPILRKWMDAVKRFNLEAFRKDQGFMEDWRPRGSGDPVAPPPHWNKKDYK